MIQIELMSETQMAFNHIFSVWTTKEMCYVNLDKQLCVLFWLLVPLQNQRRGFYDKVIWGNQTYTLQIRPVLNVFKIF